MSAYPRTQWALGEPIQSFLGFAANTTTAPGRSIQISASTSSVAITLTTVDTSTVVVNPAVGDNIYPYAITKALPAGSTSSFTFTNLL